LTELHQLEKILLLALKDGQKMQFRTLLTETHLPYASIARASVWLSSKGYAKIEKVKSSSIHLDSEGKKISETGLPERILVEAVLENGGRVPLSNLSTITKLNNDEINIALGWGRKKRWLTLYRENGMQFIIVKEKPKKGIDEELIEQFSSGLTPLDSLTSQQLLGLKSLMKRPKIVYRKEEVNRFITLTKEGLKAAKKVKKVGEEISQLTPELIKSGKWRKVRFRKYDIKAPVGKIWAGKKHPYLRFLDDLKQKLTSLGFTEMVGSTVEFMFFNCDALYMPQDHPAREIHDLYYVKSPSYGDLSSYTHLINNVKATHENGWETNSKGWRYPFSLKATRRLILRSQGTAISARKLVDEGLEIPGKYFSIARCYRPDVIDRTHLTEFNHVEGIVLGENLTFKDLLGILKMFALETAGADEVRFKPDYFPFTEPSVELSAFKADSGWLEFGGAGMFRPEVTLPLGITVPVIAWGLGVDRLFMMKVGINDIRDIFSQNLNWLRSQKVI
jgi:phenylalanyl-tRNA synthetase alpha chain